MAKYIPPVDHALEIQPETTKTASFNGPALDLGAGYEPGGLGRLVGAVVEVSSIDVPDDETYAFKLQESANGTDGWADIGFPVSAEAVGVVAPKGIITQRFVRLVLTVAGTDPEITYRARLGIGAR